MPSTVLVMAADPTRLDLVALDAAESELSASEDGRGAHHARQLRAALRVHALYDQAGLELSALPQVAMLMRSSEHRARQLLDDAMVLAALPGALDAVARGVLGVEQSRVVVTQLSQLAMPARLPLWERALARVEADAATGATRTPARLTDLLRRWVVQADPEATQERRREAEQRRTLDYRRQDNGLTDLWALGIRGPDAQAILSRIDARSAPVGVDDERTADQRRLDAFVDLCLGREALPLDSDRHCGSRSAAPCGCLPGSAVPCGAELLVHIPIGAALGTTDEVAELVGHGPVEPDLVEAFLRAGPRLRPVWVDERGVPVAVGDAVVRPATIRRRYDRRCSISSGYRHRSRSRGTRRTIAHHPTGCRLRPRIHLDRPARTGRRAGYGV